MWELIFLMLIMKIPIVYLCCVVYWAIKSEPKPPDPVTVPAVVPEPDASPGFPPCTWRNRRRTRPRVPRPSTGRSPARRVHAPAAR